MVILLAAQIFIFFFLILIVSTIYGLIGKPIEKLTKKFNITINEKVRDGGIIFIVSLPIFFIVITIFNSSRIESSFLTVFTYVTIASLITSAFIVLPNTNDTNEEETTK